MSHLTIWPSDISCVIVTRGDRDLQPVLDSLPPYDEVIIADGKLHGILARYKEALKAKNEVIYFQDDDLILHDHHALMQAYEDDGRFYANMISPEWWQEARYHDFCLVGAGSLVPKALIQDTFWRWDKARPRDAHTRLQADFIFGTLAPWKRLELETTILDAASDENALWKKPEQFEAKWEAVRKARALRTVVLTTLAKDEEESLGRTIKSAAPWIDAVLVHDTGSSDRTVDVALETATEMGLPCWVKQVEFVDFGHNRAQLLSDGRHYGDFQLLMDADEELVGLPERPELNRSMYYLHYDGELDYAQPRLIQSCLEWSWFDPVHSYLGAHDPLFSEHLEAPKIAHYGEEADYGVERLTRDVNRLVPLLEADPLDERSVFNLGKALDGLGQHEQALKAFRLRTKMGGAPEEVFYARYRQGCLEAPRHPAQGMRTLIRAWQERPWRIEPLRALAQYATEIADQAPYPKDETLFVQRSHYKEG